MLRADASLGVGLGTAGVVFGIYSQATPSIADIRVANPNDDHIESADRAALWTSIVVVSGISLIARDPTIFILGGGMALVMTWWTRHANTINPMTGAPSMAGAQRVSVLAGDSEGDVSSEMADASGF